MDEKDQKSPWWAGLGEAAGLRDHLKHGESPMIILYKGGFRLSFVHHCMKIPECVRLQKPEAPDSIDRIHLSIVDESFWANDPSLKYDPNSGYSGDGIGLYNVTAHLKDGVPVVMHSDVEGIVSGETPPLEAFLKILPIVEDFLNAQENELATLWSARIKEKRDLYLQEPRELRRRQEHRAEKPAPSGP